MKLAYLTASFPYGPGESFVSPEIEFHLENKNDFVLIPLWGRGVLKENKILKKKNLILLESDILTVKIFFNFLRFIFLEPKMFLYVLKLLFKSKTKHLIKNLVVLPKAVYISRKISHLKITHLHVHWAATTSTAGMIAAKISNIKWSFTCHRWDIYENNLLKIKADSAEFVRFISEKGKNDAVGLGVQANKAITIHMGVKMPLEVRFEEYKAVGDVFNIMCPANLIDVKGHFYLIEAVKILREKQYKVKLFLAGEGDLREELEKQVTESELEDDVCFLGQISHNELFNYYTQKKIHCVDLPSLDLGKGLHEGIPVSLMEGMSFGKLVISTKTGSIPELLPEYLNVTITDRSSTQLAELLSAYIKNPVLYKDKCIELNRLINDSWKVCDSMRKINDLINC
jgi:colanic acid/amylovoran biosynthesis glycosyltransferase